MSLNDSKSPPKKLDNGTQQEEEETKTRKMAAATVIFLDKTSFTFRMPWKSLGKALFDKVVKKLGLIEVDYFGLGYEDDAKTKYWLDNLKPLSRQVSLTTLSPTFYFCVKFYTPDPVQIEDEFTRYLFSLQIKNDLSSGCLQCNDNTAAIMISYIVQAELGDYDAEEFPDHSYLTRYKLIPFQDTDLEKKIMESHKKHIGQTPAEAELNLLETSRRCELYGIKMTAAKDHEGVPLNLATAHAGILVFQNYTKINTFSWGKIRKISFKRKKFLIKLHPEGYGCFKDIVEFFFDGRNDCKNFWKKCIENHTFFRCTDATKGMRQRPRLFSRGSSFRYSGRTQIQLSEFVSENYVKRNFQRSTSVRTTPSSPTRPSGTISPQPLLPISTSFSSESTNHVQAPASPPKEPEPEAQDIHEMTTAFTNGNGSPEIGMREASPGLTTPDSELGGYQTSEYVGQDTDDNISQDSYQLEKDDDKEPPKSLEIENVVVEHSKKTGKSSLASNVSSSSKVKKKEVQIINGKKEKKKKSKPRVWVTLSNPCLGQISPILYARAGHFTRSSSGIDSNLLQNRIRTLDFVLVNQLPSVGSFSYKDDSVEVKSPSKLKFEALRRKLVQGDSVRKKHSDPPRRKSIGSVDLLSSCTGAVSISNNTPHPDNPSHAQSSTTQVHTTSLIWGDDILLTNEPKLPSGRRRSDLEVPATLPIVGIHSLSLDQYDSLYELSLIEREGHIDPPNQYAYTSYKFAHVGRPR